MQIDTFTQRHSFFSKQQSVWVAYSGGIDSHVLLHVFKTLQAHLNFNLKAIHINHGLSPNANDWEKHCLQVCQSENVPLTVAYLAINLEKDESIESKARSLRLQIFKELLKSNNDYLLTAHHLDDQVETFFLRVLRGSGIEGLGSIEEKAALGEGTLLRPLLKYSRQELLLYAKQHQLQWIEDESNQSIQFDRNFLRQHVLPLIKERWCSFEQPIFRLIEASEEASQLLMELAEQDLLKLKGSQPNTLSVKKLKQLTLARQKNCLRAWFKQLGLLPPSFKKTEQLIKDVVLSRHEALPVIAWKGAEIRRYKDDLYAAPLIPS